MNKGKYIVLEGPEGAGKSTQALRLAAALGAVATREPGGDAFGQKLRTLLLDPNSAARNPLTDVLLHTAQRVELMDSTVRPALEAGQHVVSDRNWFSTLAYQRAQGVSAHSIRCITELAIGPLARPNLAIFLDLEPRVGLSRLASAPDYYEQQDLAFHQRVRNNYLDIASREPEVHVVDAAQAPEIIEQQIRSIVQESLAI